MLYLWKILPMGNEVNDNKVGPQDRALWHIGGSGKGLKAKDSNELNNVMLKYKCLMLAIVAFFSHSVCHFGEMWKAL